jgi:hypothetical protein
MKKLAFLLIAFITVLSFSSCEKEDEVTPDQNPVTANGNTVNPTNDTIRFSTITAGNPESMFTIDNDGVDRTDLTIMTISSSNNTNYCETYVNTHDYNGNGIRTLMGKATVNQPDFLEPGKGIAFTEHYTIQYVLTSGYSYTTTLVIIQE